MPYALRQFPFALVFSLKAILLLSSAELGRGEQVDAERPVVRVIYFIPTDRQPEPDYHARVDRVMSDVQRFYRRGMEENGYGPMTFELDRDPEGTLRIHEVHAEGPMRDYGRNDSAKVRREVKEALEEKGLDIDREMTIIFQLLLDWQEDKAIEVGPYLGGGGTRSGTAWVYDDSRLDAALLASPEPGGYYNKPCSLGKFNTHYIGGVAHELGHAFGLPHDRERDSQRPSRGRSLMGSGNHHYGEELRGEGPGAFLTAASALPLSVHPLFTGRRLPPATMTCRIADLEATHQDDRLVLTGRLEGGPPAVGVVAYNDPLATPHDYDAVGWTCPVGADGTFRLEIGELKPGLFELRLRAYGTSGDARSFTFRYEVDEKRRPDLQPFAGAVRLQEAMSAFRARDAGRLAAIGEALAKQAPADAVLRRKVEHLRALLSPPATISLTDVPRETSRAEVVGIEAESASVGWGRPLRNQVLPEGESSCLIEVGGRFFESGLYAHAPSRYTFRLNGDWMRFTTKYGLQDGRRGSVVFVVKGDGRELFRSGIVRDHNVGQQTLEVAGVALLELIVEDGGDGNRSDWGVWIEPQLQR